MFSFGIILTETGSRAFPDDLKAHDPRFMNKQFMFAEAAGKGFAPKPTRAFEAVLGDVWAMAQRCFDGDPGARPTFNRIAQTFENSRKERDVRATPEYEFWQSLREEHDDLEDTMDMDDDDDMLFSASIGIETGGGSEQPPT